MSDKFKFWLGHTKKMTYAHTIDEIGKIIPEFTKDIITRKFTGRTDRHGEDVYSGDILKSLHFTEGNGKRHYLYHRVAWCDRLMGWQAIAKGQKGTENNGNPQLWVYAKNTEFEIAGNIYENPELGKRRAK